MSTRSALRLSGLMLSSAVAANLLSGCAVNGGGASTPVAPSAHLRPASFSGMVHGGQQSVTGAVVTLWAAGTATGYGQGATALATTATDAKGVFNLDPPTLTPITGYAIANNVITFTTSSAGSYTPGQIVTVGSFPTSTFLNGQEVTVLTNTATSFTASFTNANVNATTESGQALYFNSTVSQCTAGQYLYITVNGGNPGLGGVYGAINNANLAMMLALPTPCAPAATGSTFVNINEVTTAAAVTALQQFMKINPSGSEPTFFSQATPPWTIGAPSTNVSGLANAFAATINLVNPSTGSTALSTSSPFIVNSTVGGVSYTTQVQPDVLKLNTFADVLAACINTGGGSGVCSNLAADTTPSGSPAPIDTIEMAYYLATNPGGLTMPQHGIGSPYYLCQNYITAQAPFAPTEVCSGTTPSFYDWTMPVKWTLYNASATKLSITPTSVAIDAGGHIWTGGNSGYTTVSPINEFNVSGNLMLSGPVSVTIPTTNLTFTAASTPTPMSAFPAQTGVALTYTRQDAIAIDTSGNVFAGQNGPAVSPATLTSSGAVTLPTGMIVEVPSGSVSGAGTGILSASTVAGLAVSGANDVFISDLPVTARSYSSVVTAASGYTTLNEGGFRSTSAYQGVVVDQAGVSTAFTSSGTCVTGQQLHHANAAAEASEPVSAPVPAVSPTIVLTNQCANYGTVDATNNLWITGNSVAPAIVDAAYVDLTPGTLTPYIVQIPSGTGGLVGPTGIAVDGAGNIWAISGVTGASGLSEFTPAIVTATANGDTLNAVSGTTVLSPSAVNGFAANYTLGTLKGVSIDSSGNLWLKVSGSSLEFVVGAAAPVLTPTAAQLAKTPGTVGSVGNRP